MIGQLRALSVRASVKGQLRALRVKSCIEGAIETAES